MALSETLIANLALARIGSPRINALDTDETVGGKRAREHYAPCRDGLLRSHSWAFAMARKTLSASTETPSFQWAYQYALPSDCLRVTELYDTTSSYVIEGKMLLTDDDTAQIRYIRQVTDPTQFDALFVEVLVLKLALALVMPLAQDKQLRQLVGQEYEAKLGEARHRNMIEAELIGRDDNPTWNDSRISGVSE